MTIIYQQGLTQNILTDGYNSGIVDYYNKKGRSMEPNPENELIGVREAARECGRNMETVRRWIWGGKLPAQKLGNQLFIKRGDLASFCRETAVRPYDVGEKKDSPESAIRFGNKLRTRGYPEVEATALARKSREERTEGMEQDMKKTADAFHRREAMLGFLHKAKALRNEIHARTGRMYDAEAMIRELRDEREHELE